MGAAAARWGWGCSLAVGVGAAAAVRAVHGVAPEPCEQHTAHQRHKIRTPSGTPNGTANPLSFRTLRGGNDTKHGPQHDTAHGTPIYILIAAISYPLSRDWEKVWPKGHISPAESPPRMSRARRASAPHLRRMGGASAAHPRRYAATPSDTEPACGPPSVREKWPQVAIFVAKSCKFPQECIPLPPISMY